MKHDFEVGQIVMMQFDIEDNYTITEIYEKDGVTYVDLDDGDGYKPTKVSIERIRPLRNRDEYRS